MSQTCLQCGVPRKNEARFCGSCGAPQPDPVEDADAVARYRSVLASFASAGGLQARELQQLETLRQRLGLSLTTHERLLAEHEASAPAPVTLRLAIDVATMRHFEVESRCLIRFKLDNLGDLALETLELHSWVHGGERLEPVSSATLFPGLEQVVRLWLVPQVAGFHELRGVLVGVDLMGERAFHGFEGVQFRVGSSGAGAAVSVVHIDQSSARVVDNSRTNIGGTAPAAGGLVADAEWREVPIRRLSAARAAQLAPALAHLVGEPVADSPDAEAGAGVEDDDLSADRNERHAVTSPAVSASVDFKVTTERDSYHSTRSLAEGDLANVYCGRRLSDGAPVAVKVAYEAADNDLMQAEIRAIDKLRAEDSKQLKHLPVRLDQFRTGDGRIGTVFELLDGYDLFTIREKLPDGVPARHVVWILRRCLSVLGWAHSHGVLHGNLDPSHIVVRPHDHNVWLIDWCYAIVNPAQTGQSFRCLNEEYSPPEVSARKPPLPSSDLYSLGKCMIYALGGDPAEKRLPDGIDERLARFLLFFVRESALGRAQDAWDMYTQLDRLRRDIWGKHKFVEFKI